MGGNEILVLLAVIGLIAFLFALYFFIPKFFNKADNGIQNLIGAKKNQQKIGQVTRLADRYPNLVAARTHGNVPGSYQQNNIPANSQSAYGENQAGGSTGNMPAPDAFRSQDHVGPSAAYDRYAQPFEVPHPTAPSCEYPRQTASVPVIPQPQQTPAVPRAEVSADDMKKTAGQQEAQPTVDRVLCFTEPVNFGGVCLTCGQQTDSLFKVTVIKSGKKATRNMCPACTEKIKARVDKMNAENT